VDSLLRGNIRGETHALMDQGFGVVAVLAVPRIGRTVRGGIVHVDGVELSRSVFESGGPASVATAIGRPSVIISTELIRSREAEAEARVHAAIADGVVPVFDADTQQDLDLIAELVLRLPTRTAVLAAGGLAHSLAPRRSHAGEAPQFAPGAARVVTVVGTIAAGSSRQVERLVAAGPRHLVVQPGDAVTLGDHDTVVTFDSTAVWQDAELREATKRVARAVALLKGRTDLVLTGGETARRVLDVLGIRRMFAEELLDDGVVLSTTDGGRAVVTKPGSFGGEDILARVFHHLKGAS
jgi:4-hydroxythreonine-4-phosphate dehydrogenase